MTARRSFKHSMAKFETQTVPKPVAILTAWRGTLLDANGKPYSESARRQRNDAANEALVANLRRRGLSHYPVVGAGQEDDDGLIVMKKENSFVVEPLGSMSEQAFIDHIQQLLFNPTGEAGNGPFPHTQWGAIVKLPSNPQAFLLHHDATLPASPADYRVVDFIGNTARPRQGEPFYTQMKYGPRADASMLDAFDQPDDVGNIAGQLGQRFTIRDVL